MSVSSLASISETVFPGKRSRLTCFGEGGKAPKAEDDCGLIPLSVYLYSDSEEVDLGGQKSQQSSIATVTVTAGIMHGWVLLRSLNSQLLWRRRVAMSDPCHVQAPWSTSPRLTKEAGGFLKVRRRFQLLKNVEQKPDKDCISKSWLYFSPHLFLFHLSLL